MRLLLTVVPLLALTTACASTPTAAPSAGPSTIRVSSPDFTDGGVLPARFTCTGAGDTPALRWSGLPAGTRAIAVTLTDPDAPRGTFTHWAVYDLPATATELTTVPSGARQATTSAGAHGYSPPCPPSGTHHYHFTVTALGASLTAPDGTGFAEVAREVAARRLADGHVTATVTR